MVLLGAGGPGNMVPRRWRGTDRAVMCISRPDHAGERIKFRMPTDAPMVRGHEADFAAAGFVSPTDWELHVLARRMDPGMPIPAANPQRVVLEDQPQPILPPRW